MNRTAGCDRSRRLSGSMRRSSVVRDYNAFDPSAVRQRYSDGVDRIGKHHELIEILWAIACAIRRRWVSIVVPPARSPKNVQVNFDISLHELRGLRTSNRCSEISERYLAIAGMDDRNLLDRVTDRIVSDRKVATQHADVRVPMYWHWSGVGLSRRSVDPTAVACAALRRRRNGTVGNRLVASVAVFDAEYTV